MATLNNPVNKFNVVDRFSDFVTTTANAGIVWGTNNRPSPYFTSQYLGFEPFGGTTAGIPIDKQAVSNTITDAIITAGTVYNVLVQETRKYSSIRNLRARVNVTGAGGNTPLGPLTPSTPGIVFDQTAKSYLSTTYLQSLGTPGNAGVSSGQNVRSANLENFFSNLQSQYNVYRDTLVTLTVNVCHSSCHSSCHGSRGRR